jgi:hypothetical protein
MDEAPQLKVLMLPMMLIRMALRLFKPLKH